MNTPKFLIYPEPSAKNLVQQFNLIGTVDINATAALETLYVLPVNCEVELDFAMVQRVNSMGLAQLLKLFEYWKNQSVRICIINTSRMISVLFKMTGLNHFLREESATTSDSNKICPDGLSSKQKTEKIVDSVAQATAQMIAFPNKKNIKPESKVINRKDELKLWVSAQNNHQVNGWYFFNNYLQRHLKREVQMQLVYGAMSQPDEVVETMDFVFTNPFESARLSLVHDFKPLLRLAEQTDEVTLLARADDRRQQISDFTNCRVVTTAANNFVYLLGRFLLEEAQTEPENFNYVFAGQDIKAVQMLLKGDSDILLMLTDTYNGLAGITRKMLHVIDQSETGFAFHLLSVAPHCQDLGAALADVLLKMVEDSQGRQVLTDLDVEGWSEPKEQEIYMMEMLFKRYNKLEGYKVNASQCNRIS